MNRESIGLYYHIDKNKKAYHEQLSVIEDSLYEHFDSPNVEKKNNIFELLEKGKELEEKYKRSYEDSKDFFTSYGGFCEDLIRHLNLVETNIANAFCNSIQIFHSSMIKKNVLESKQLSEFNQNFAAVLQEHEKKALKKIQAITKTTMLI